MSKYKKIKVFVHTPSTKIKLKNKIIDLTEEETVQKKSEILLYPCPNCCGYLHLNENFFNQINKKFAKKSIKEFKSDIEKDFKENPNKYKKLDKTMEKFLSLKKEIKKDEFLREITTYGIKLEEFLLICILFLNKGKNYVLIEETYDVNIAYGCGVPSGDMSKTYFIIEIPNDKFSLSKEKLYKELID